MIAVQSEALETVEYDAAHRTLTLTFRSGGTYRYHDVDEGLYAELLSAQPHPWARVGSRVKAHRYTRTT